MLGLQHAGSSERKRKENKCKFTVQMTRVQRVPCFSCISLYTEIIRRKYVTTDFFCLFFCFLGHVN